MSDADDVTPPSEVQEEGLQTRLLEPVGTGVPREWRLWTAAALVVFVVTGLYQFRALVGEDLSEVVLAQIRTDRSYEPGVYPAGPLQETDHRFVIWQVARNAYTLLERPIGIFDAEPCFPVENSLALGESSIGLGVVAVPAYLVSRDPVATYNLVFLGMTLLAAFAAYLLVREFTGVPAAGIVAGALFAFSTYKTMDPVHYWARDPTWGLFCLLYSRRLFAGSARWRDAFGLGAATSLQIAGSFYPLLATVVIAVPYSIWLLLAYGFRRVRLPQLALVFAMVGITSVVVLGPYLSLQGSGGLEERTFQYFMPLFYLLPGNGFFSGWLLYGLVVAGLLLGRKRGLAIAEDPRWALLLGGLMVWNLAAGGNQGDIVLAIKNGEPVPDQWPNLYTLLAQVIPGLDVVRAPAAMWGGTLAMLCVLAGVGAAAILRSLPPRGAWLGQFLLIALAAGEAVAPAAFANPTGYGFTTYRMRPDAKALAFYEKLAELGNEGPILEMPVHHRNLWKTSSTVMLSAYHRRRISACFNSNIPPEVEAVKELGFRLPERAAIEELRELGFTTIVLNHEPRDRRAGARRKRFKEFEETPEGDIVRRLEWTRSRTAYAIQEAIQEPIQAPAPHEAGESVR